MEGIFHHQNFLYIYEVIFFKIISLYYNNLLICHFGIEKT